MSQVEGKTKTIDGVEYTVYHMPAKRAAKLLAKLGGVAVPALGVAGAIKKGAGSLLDAEIDGALFSKLAGEAFDRLDEALLDDLLGSFAEVTVVTSGKLSDSFDLHFRGRMAALVEWLSFCLQNEYGEVLKKTLGGIGRVGLGMKLPTSDSPPTSPKIG